MSVFEIGVLDNGSSIPGNFYSKGVMFNLDSDAINLALNGTSTKTGEGRGRGLPTSKSLVVEGLKGDFLVMSRKGFVFINKKRRDIKLLKNGLDGTMIFLKFKQPQTNLNIYDFVS